MAEAVEGRQGVSILPSHSAVQEQTLTSSQPPYIANTAAVGGRPTVDVDVPALSVFCFLYLVGAIANMAVFQVNRRKGHKFFMSWAMFGFCMARVGTCVLRIAWTTHLTNTGLAIASSIFLSVGVLVGYVVVLLLATRILRATHPKLGWNRRLRMFTFFLYGLLFVAIVLVITFTLLSLYTLDTTIRSVSLWVQRGALLYMLLFNFVSAVFVLLSLIMPRDDNAENFGTGSIGSKIFITGVAVFFCIFISGFRCGTVWASPRPASDPAWYDSRAAFYVIMLGFEIVIIYLFLGTRFDRRFWVPNGSKRPGDYSRIHKVHSDIS